MVKSISYDQTEIISNILELHVPEHKIDCDPTFSKGVFYKDTGIELPKYKFDIYPQSDDVKFGDSRNLPLESNSLYKVLGVFLQGSQNYGLAYEGSDINTKCIVLPSFEDFCLNKKPTSTTLILPSNEHIDLKDIRLMFDCFKKQNVNFVEILFTQYRKFNPEFEELYMPMLENAEVIAKYNNYAFINCMAGMCMEKYKALEHPYPTLVEKIEKFGYDPKQLHHIIRMNEFMIRYIAGESYKDCLTSKKAEYLIDVKRGCHTLEEARQIAKSTLDDTIRRKNEYMESNPLAINKFVEELMNEVLISVLKKSFILELGV